MSFREKRWNSLANEKHALRATATVRVVQGGWETVIWDLAPERRSLRGPPSVGPRSEENLAILGAIVAIFIRKPRAQHRADKSSYVCACYLKEMHCMLKYNS